MYKECRQMNQKLMQKKKKKKFAVHFMERGETAVFATSATQYNTQNWVHIMHSAENRAFQFLMQPF